MSKLSSAVLHPTPSVRHRVVDGLAVLLDLRAGEYVVLDRVATAMWRALVRTEPQRRVAQLTAAFDAPAERLEADLESFARECVARGFLAERAPPALERPRLRGGRRAFLTLRAWWSLLATTRSLARHGFAQTYEAYARLPAPDPAAPRSAAAVERSARAFARAEHFFVIRSAPKDCLPRSLALYRFMLAAGIPVQHCIGVVRYPFEAHAWVEHERRPLFDTEEFVRSYAELARL